MNWLTAKRNASESRLVNRSKWTHRVVTHEDDSPTFLSTSSNFHGIWVKAIHTHWKEWRLRDPQTIGEKSAINGTMGFPRHCLHSVRVLWWCLMACLSCRIQKSRRISAKTTFGPWWSICVLHFYTDTIYFSAEEEVKKSFVYKVNLFAAEKTS